MIQALPLLQATNQEHRGMPLLQIRLVIKGNSRIKSAGIRILSAVIRKMIRLNQLQTALRDVSFSVPMQELTL